MHQLLTTIAADAVLALFIYLAGINLVAFLAFARDKHCARNGMWRVPEQTLLGLALIGGVIGIWAGRRVFRHKTRKQPFLSQLWLITGAQATLLLALSVPVSRQYLLETVLSLM